MINKEFILEWTATAVLLVGVMFTSLNMYPINLYVCMLGNFLWMFLGVMWKKYSLITIQLIVSVMYVYGIYISLTNNQL